MERNIMNTIQIEVGLAYVAAYGVMAALLAIAT